MFEEHFLGSRCGVSGESVGLGRDVLECEACECREDGLGGQMAGTEIRGGEGQDFKGKDFCFNHDETGEGEADHGEPVVEGWSNVRR